MRKFGFIDNLSPIIRGEENDSLLVSINGGENFESVNIVFPLDMKDTLFYVYENPKLENGRLEMRLFAPEFSSWYSPTNTRSLKGVSPSFITAAAWIKCSGSHTVPQS